MSEEQRATISLGEIIVFETKDWKVPARITGFQMEATSDIAYVEVEIKWSEVKPRL